MIAKPPTLEDVAQAAGVSAATISRCINTPERVAKGTRLRIQAAIDALGYTPNFGGRALATRRTNIIGAVIPTTTHCEQQLQHHESPKVRVVMEHFSMEMQSMVHQLRVGHRSSMQCLGDVQVQPLSDAVQKLSHVID